MYFCSDCANIYEVNTEICPFCGANTAEGRMPKEPYHIVPGTMLKGGKYLIGRAIGYGGFGVTYAALDTVLQRRVAIKEYLPSDFATRSPGTLSVSVFNGDDNSDSYIKGLQSFVNEADRLKKFRHIDSIVTIYDSFTENDTAYIVMELLDGQTLKDRLNETGTMSFEDSLSIIAPVLSALDEVHKVGIIHRDISPDNIFLTNDGKVKILDFGAARYASAEASKSLSVILKPGYAPPEQYRSRSNQGPWSDVYAVAATMYRMLTGIVPDESLERAANDNLKAPSKLGVRIPQYAENALHNALNTNWKCRTQSAGMFLYQLTDGREVTNIDDEPIRTEGAKLPKWVIASIAGVLALGAVFAALVLTNVIPLGRTPGVDLNTGDLIAVPNLIGSTETAAIEAYGDMFEFKTVDSAETSDVPVGCIMEQSPTWGQSVPTGTVIELIVNKGETEANTMPYLRAESVSEAVAALERMGCTCSIEYAYDATLVSGKVMSTEPEFGADISSGGEVKLTVSLGGLLDSVRIDHEGEAIELEAGSEGVVPEYTLSPANVDESKVTVSWASDNEGVAAFEGGRLVPKGAGEATVMLIASMTDETNGGEVVRKAAARVVVTSSQSSSASAPAPSGTPRPGATAAPTASSAPGGSHTSAPEITPAPPSGTVVVFSDPTFAEAFKSKYGTIYESQLSDFYQLMFNGCGLSNVRDISKFRNLTSLNFSSNNISNIDAVSGLTKLKSLQLDHNNLNSLNAIKGLTQLTNLNVSSNSLSSLTALSGLTKLTTLNVSGNHLSSLSALSSLRSLTTLYADGNSISDLSPLRNLSQLKVLSLNYNNISDLAPLYSLTNLTTLYLKGNNLSQSQLNTLHNRLPNCTIYTDNTTYTP